MHPLSLAVLPLVSVALFGGTLTACASSVIPDRNEDRYTDLAEFRASADDAFAETEWIPADATRLAAVTDDDGVERMLRWSSAILPDPAVCSPGPLTGTPGFETNWWPSGQPPEGIVCGEWQVFARGTDWYAWTSES